MRGQDTQRRRLPTPVRTRSGPKGDKWRCVLAGEPDPPLRQARPHRPDVILEVDLLLFLLFPAPHYLPGVVAVRHWCASPRSDLKVGVGSIPCQIIAKPICGENSRGGTVSVAGLVVRKTAVVRAEKVVEHIEILGGIGAQATDQRQDVFRAWVVSVDQKCRLGVGPKHCPGRQRDRPVLLPLGHKFWAQEVDKARKRLGCAFLCSPVEGLVPERGGESDVHFLKA